MNNSQNRGNQVQTDQMHPTAVQPKSVQPGGKFALPAWLPTWLRPKKNLPPLTWRDFILLPIFFGLLVYGMYYFVNYLAQYNLPNIFLTLAIGFIYLSIMFLYRKNTSRLELLCLFFIGIFSFVFLFNLLDSFFYLIRPDFLVFLLFGPFLILRLFKLVASNLYFLFAYAVLLFYLILVFTSLLPSS